LNARTTLFQPNCVGTVLPQVKTFCDTGTILKDFCEF